MLKSLWFMLKMRILSGEGNTVGSLTSENAI